jgi:hypothetical protein
MIYRIEKDGEHEYTTPAAFRIRVSLPEGFLKLRK